MVNCHILRVKCNSCSNVILCCKK